MGGVEEKLADNQEIMEVDRRLEDACETLRQHVDSLNSQSDLHIIGGVFKPRDKQAICSVTVDGVEIGYRLQNFITYINRQVFIKTPGNKIEDCSKEEKARIMTAVFNVFVVQGAALPTIDAISFDCLLLQQQVIPLIPVERAPRLRSIAGGLGA